MIKNHLNSFISYRITDNDKFSLGIKDNICVGNFFATCGSEILKDYFPGYNATVVQRLIDNSFDIAGKTNMDEFAMGATGLNSSFGIVRNPLNSNYIPGGSSSGSAVAVAANEVDVALGSDTGGSVRIPAAFCGVLGFKPTYGALSRYGLISFSSSLDVIGIFSKRIELLKSAFAIAAGKDKLDPTSIELNNDKPYKNKLNIAYINIDDMNVNNEIKKSYNEAINKISKYHNTTPVNTKYHNFHLSVYMIISSCEAASNLSRFDNKLFGNKEFRIESYDKDKSKYRSKYFGSEVKRRIMTGNFALSSEYSKKYYTKASKLRRMIKNEYDDILKNYDMIISPTSPVLPFKITNKNTIIDNYNTDLFTSGVSLAGNPAINIPYPKKTGDFYPGIQLIGNYGDDYRLLEFAEIIKDLF